MREKTGYSALQIGLHWLVVVLIGVNYFVSDGMGRAFRQHMNGTDTMDTMTSIHVYLGLSVFFIALIRLTVRLVQGAPKEIATGNVWLDRAGRWAHAMLYILIILVPWLGGLAWYKGVAQAADLHVVVMNLMLILAGLHAVAALFHQYVLKDGLLMRMVRPG